MATSLAVANSSTFSMDWTVSPRQALPLLRKRSRLTLVSSSGTSSEIFHLLINALPDPAYTLAAPIALTLERSGSSVIASFEAANVHMSGDTIQQAIDGALSHMLDLFEMLDANKADLS